MSSTSDPAANPVPHRLSAVIMNWARPDNVRAFLARYARHPRVGEAIVWDSSAAHALTDQCGWFDFDAPDEVYRKVRYVRSAFDFGLYPRFAFGALAAETGVLLVDDDIELPDAVITRLHDEYLKEPRIVLGLIGRQPAANGAYAAPTVHGPCQIVLTRALVTSPWLCGKAMAWGARCVRQLPGVPRGNGEDILLSHVAMAESGLLNRAYDLPYHNVGFDDANAISVRVKGHGEHRTDVVRWCRSNILNGKIPSA